MSEPDFAGLLGAALSGALQKRGFTELTAVQKTVLDPALAGRDLRITSQTGSGKTVAIGFALRDLVAETTRAEGGVARPKALVVAPTRELAKQVEEELSWLYAPLHARVASATGGASLRDERRALAAGPAVVVGTPGRMLDHLNRGAIDASQVGAVVLDEADRLLDMGFREELEAILAFAPEGHRTHLVSATFPREVRALADAVQDDEVAHVEGTKLGAANVDIDHVLHLVDARDRLGAIVNLLLANPDEQMLVFARTRADVGDLADALVAAGFAASSLSGEMEQPARDRALAAFKRGDLRVLVATDVAARGIDVQDIGRVLHADPPGDADTYTHRSGRTGRAGRKGVSSVLVPPSVMAKVIRLMQRAGVTFRFAKLPGAAEIRAKSEERVFETLTGEDDAGATPDERALALAERLAQAENVPRTIARLLMRARQATGPEPRDIRMIEPPSSAPRATRRGMTGHLEGRTTRQRGFEGRPAFGADRPRFDSDRPRFDSDRSRFDSDRPRFDSDRARGDSDRPGFEAEGTGRDSDRPRFDSDRPRFDSDRPPASSQRFPSQRPPRDLSREWASFQVSWGEAHGADSRRMLAMLCRRGGIGSGDVGAIRIGRVASTVEIARDVAEPFAEAAGQIDARDPRIVIRPIEGGGERPTKARRTPARTHDSELDAEAHTPYPREHAPRAKAPRDVRQSLPREHAPYNAPSPERAPHAKKARPAEARPRKAAGAPARYPAAKTKGWVKKPGARAARAGDAPPKRRRTA